MTPGFHLNVPMRDYLNEPAVSASLLHEIDTRCPRAAWYCSWLNPKRPLEESTSAQGVGTVAHQILLEGSMDCVTVIDPALYPNKTGGVPEGWKNPAIRAARDAAIAAGKVPLLPDQVAPIEAMVQAAYAYIATLERTQPAIFAALQPGGGESEVVIRWDERDGTPCKIRADRISLDRRVVIDYKTTQASAEPDAWFRWQAMKLGYPMASAFYRRGVKAAMGVDTEYVWLVQEQDPPYLCSLVGLDPMGQDLAERRMRRALCSWAACVSVDRWPGYPSDVCYPETPSWEAVREEEVAARGNPYDPAQMYERRQAAAVVDALPDVRAA